MYLNASDRIKCDKLRASIIRSSSDDYYKCSKCNTTGLSGVYKNSDGSFSWSDIEGYCDNCQGVGYKLFDKKEGVIVCSICQGLGCSRCANKGVVDWIEAAMLGVVNFFKGD